MIRIPDLGFQYQALIKILEFPEAIKTSSIKHPFHLDHWRCMSITQHITFFKFDPTITQNTSFNTPISETNYCACSESLAVMRYAK